jgi:hypothetical protein
MKTFRLLEEEIYDENRNKLEDIGKEIEEIEEEVYEILKKLEERKYSTSDEEYEKGILIELKGDIYVYIDHEIDEIPRLECRALPRNTVAYECEGFPDQEAYKKILRRFKKYEDVGKKDLIELIIFSSDLSIVEFLRKEIAGLLIIWFHERYGHIELDRKLGIQKWAIWMQYVFRLLNEKISQLKWDKEIIKKMIKYIKYQIKKEKVKGDIEKLGIFYELYSFLTELFYLFYKVYRGDPQARKILQYSDRYNPSCYLTFPKHHALKYLQRSKIGKILHKFSENPDNFTNKDLENVIILIDEKIKGIGETLKNWLENEVYEKLVEIEKELNEMKTLNKRFYKL